jgi:hypothetical protein
MYSQVPARHEVMPQTLLSQLSIHPSYLFIYSLICFSYCVERPYIAEMYIYKPKFLKLGCQAVFKVSGIHFTVNSP